MRILKFSKPHGPVFHYEEATNISFGDQPHLRDPLDKKYIHVKESSVSGEGIHAAKDIPAYISVVTFGGYLYNAEQHEIWIRQIKEKSRANGWMKDHPMGSDMESQYIIELFPGEFPK